ncbi:xanthine dehydrogenase accessory protein XdhC [Mesorhizobium sp. Root554]|uniref:xanthine dehydrogenase accessory protein XdhC n=1 Tax=unclassified Mesorhizobium TaxID=325217 RepID=UPI0006FE8D77|nr:MULTISPECIES: xanthine dehydrogenase accessory protein XdhC [unclassified Mesorhizobium]KQZ12678.1 xanthine dehydrogenase accessory protein XdhC [Mesorhizobium sp. Root1471]KQZ35200.1 xanthine dehydrogenase accessory protein XdhC [Mesorhizobium sp. Root554]
MTSAMHKLRQFLATAEPLALVEVAATKGSTPREKGAFMLVSRVAILGTIGGGQLEYMAIDKARQMLGSSTSPLWGGSTGETGRGGSGKNHTPRTPALDLLSDPPHKGGVSLTVPLGPEIGQCCGGSVNLSIRKVDEILASDLVRTAETEDAALPHLYIFGGGHVGHALAASAALLPIKVVVVETRAGELEGMPEGVETRLTAVPEEVVRDAPSGSAFTVLTHDHALDFLIVAEALRRGDAAYVGMIGSKTKKATFRSWFLKTAAGTEEQFARLVSPIGGNAVKDKRPEVIAALAAAEVMTALARHEEITRAGQARQSLSIR